MRLVTASLLPRVAEQIRVIAAREVLPRYRALSAGEIEEKAPGDLVTVADRAVEAALAEALAGVLPEARFLGEERCAADPGLLGTLDGEGLVWVVDPIDGTGNFAAGRPPFAVMVALLRDGETIASWIHDPLSGRMAMAERGGGAQVDGAPLAARARPADAAALRGIVSSFQMPVAMAGRVAALAGAVAEVAPTARCAGHEYPLVAAGERDFALYWRTLVWDHAAGALLLAEAGGAVQRLDGASYRPGSTETGLILARSPEVAETVRRMLA